MDSIQVEELVRAGIPGADAVAEINIDGMTLTVCFDAKHQLDAHRRIYTILAEAGIVQSVPYVAIKWFADEREFLTWKVKASIAEALESDPPKRRGVDVSIKGEVLAIRCGELAESSVADVRVRIRSVQEKLLSLAKARWLDLQFAPPSSGSALQWGYPKDSDSPDDDVDDVVSNPNWPSRTGNPSGGGRGNNPPRR